MKRLALVLLACLMMGFTGCPSNPVIVPEGPKAAQLGVEKDKQIEGLSARVKAEQEAREMERVLASKAASNIKGILKAREYLEPSLPSDAIKAEGDLGLTRLPTDDPAETVKALERVVLIVTGQRDEAEKRYREADAQTKLERAAKEAKDREIEKRDAELKKRESEIERLKTEAIAEKEKHAKDVADALAKKDAEFAEYKKAQEDKERRMWVNGIRIVGLLFIVAGGVLLGIFKMIGPGVGALAVGFLIGLGAVGFDQLTQKSWFPYAAGVVILAALVGVYFAIRRLWIKSTLDDKKTAAIQDYIDEKTVKGETASIEDLKAHLTYRMGGKESVWGKRQTEEIVKLGLIDPKGEEALKVDSTG